VLINTGKGVDGVIFEGFKGPRNRELELGLQRTDKRIFPALEMSPVATAPEEFLFSAEQLDKV
jgi:transcription termination factor Rho